MSVPLRIVFMGTAELACPSLEALCAEKSFQVLAAVTQPDRPKGRDLKLAPSAVKLIALKHDIPVLQPERARHEAFVNQLAELKPDLVVVVAYGQILPRSILELPRYGALNVHASLLPKYRGAAPIQWAILNDEKATGVTIMKMDEGLDTGDMLSTITIAIAPEHTASTLHDRLAKMGAELLLKTIPDYISGRIKPIPQPSIGATYARKIKKEDGRIDWTRPAHEIWNMVRALAPWPGAFTFVRVGDRSKLLKLWNATEEVNLTGAAGTVISGEKAGIIVACGNGSLRITSLQIEGGKKLAAAEFLKGHALNPGTKLG